MIFKIIFFLFLQLIFLSSYSAFEKNKVLISKPWIRAMPKNSLNSAAYMKILNFSKTSEILEFAKTNISEEIRFHKIVSDNKNIKKMKKISSIHIKANSSINIEPGRIHFMLTNLKEDLIEGDEIEIDLFFKNSGIQKITFKVVKE